MSITAKFPGTCSRCRGPIVKGQTIEGERGRGYVHTDCAVQSAAATQMQAVDPSLADTRPSSEGQRDLIGNLLDEGRMIPLGTDIPDDLAELSFSQASVLIDTLLASSKGPRASLPGADQVPAGRYALEDGDTLQLVKVYRGSRNPDYVRVYDDDDPDTEYNAGAVLRRILKAGPFAAAQRYGQLRGRCSRCGRKLEDKLSVELAIGPVCGAKFHPKAVWTVMKKLARDSIRARGEDPNAPAEHSGDTVTV